MYNEYPDDPVPTMPIGRMKNPLMSQSMHDPFSSGYEIDERMNVPQGLPAKTSPRMQNIKMPQPEADFYDNATLNQSMRLMKMAAMMNKSKRTIQRFNYYNQPEQFDEWNMTSQQPIYQEEQFVDYNQMQNIPRFSEPQRIHTPRGQIRNEMPQAQNNEFQMVSPKRDLNRPMYPQENQFYMQEPPQNQNMRSFIMQNDNMNLKVPQQPTAEGMMDPNNFRPKSDKRIELKPENDPELLDNEMNEEEPEEIQATQTPQEKSKGK